MNTLVFIDTEVNPEKQSVLDYGAFVDDYRYIHTNEKRRFRDFLVQNSTGEDRYLCGHNIVHHDAKYIAQEMQEAGIDGLIDTLYLSPLCFPNKPYHALLKDDKLQADELNNPLNDCKKAMELFYDEVDAFRNMHPLQREIYATLLSRREEFRGFFSYVGFRPDFDIDAAASIRDLYRKNICVNCNLEELIARFPVELAYVLAAISAQDTTSMMPGWVIRNFSNVSYVIKKLCNTLCYEKCPYCREKLDIHKRLKQIFGYDDFRKFEGENLQERAAQAAVDHKSVLAIFPTGGGKSITFQLPALIAGAVCKALTVVISPLQSLMKDQVDNLDKRGIVDAVTINGLISPIERANALERVENGMASLLYISPESLRSNTIEQLLMKRNVARFVIDEAHCFSAWGQDFRVDYLYIGDFIRQLQEKKRLVEPIPVSCFTATAKQKVISDIKEYFKEKLSLDLEIFASSASRKNLRYEVLYKESDEEKYATLRLLVEQKKCPTIVYVSRARRTNELAKKLCEDGISALPFHGQMDRGEKQENQDAFIGDKVQVMVATSAFGMGVDKPNVGLVVHYDISDSLENYVQEAGRAGRDQNLQAECYVLFHDEDLDKHFMLLNQTKLSISEIQQVWRAIKNLTKSMPSVQRTPLEIARYAGWDESVRDIETRVKTAIQALENAGYVKRGKNIPHVYATSILVKNMIEASQAIRESKNMTEKEQNNAARILSMLISARSVAKADDRDGESRIDYIADKLGLEREETFKLIHLLREEKILADTNDLTAYLMRTDTENKSLRILKRYSEMETFLIKNIRGEGQILNLKELNERAAGSGIKSATVNTIKTILYFWTIKKYIRKSIENTAERTMIVFEIPRETFLQKRIQCFDLASFIVKYLYEQSIGMTNYKEQLLLGFSLFDLRQAYQYATGREASNQDVEDALLYLSKIDAMKLEGGFLVLYSGMQITRLELDNKIQYKADDYKSLNEYYRQKMQQIHIVGEYANMMVRDYGQALQFVNDYFQMDYKLFITKYFKGNRKYEINRNITPEKFNKLFGGLSDIQREIIDDDQSRYIVVAAGPGSGKTKILVHKLASLMLLEDVKHEQLLMVTFSRAATNEFRQRLYELIGNAVGFIEIKTFHSYCFDLMGRIGNLDSTKTVVSDASKMIRDGDVEIGRITKTVLVIDEAQDMDADEYGLVSALMERNEDMRVIAVGDDDQNIYQFRGSDSKYLEMFLKLENAKKYELLDNYRSARDIVEFANRFVKSIARRMKSAPIISRQEIRGSVQLIKCKSKNLEELVVRQAAAVLKEGTVCILTNTNDEAFRVTGLLKKKHVQAKLIMSNDAFDLYNMIEMRYFIMKVEKDLHTPIISEDRWKWAKEKLEEHYRTSRNLELCLAMLQAFELGNLKKYRSDFEMFLHESKIEDFIQSEGGKVLVSTIHKAKGREFDEVIMLLDHVSPDTDESKRKLYVGMTRAKKDLYVYYNDGAFERFQMPGTQQRTDDRIYERPKEILMQLSHRDVNLGFFKNKKDVIRHIIPGAELIIDSDGLSIMYEGKEVSVVRFSNDFMKIIEKNKKQGYRMDRAYVRFIVGWTEQEEEKEYPIILPDLYFTM